MVHFPRIKEGTEAAKGHPQNFSQSRRVWGGIAAAVSTAVCVASMMVLAHNPSSVPRRQGAIPDQRTTQLMEGLGGGGGVDPASLAEFTRYLEGGVKRKSRRDRTVTCDGGSSVACVASGAMEGIESDLQRSPDTPGKEAVEVASRGRGFQAWPSRFLGSKRAEEGRQKVALASRARRHNGIERVFDSIWKGYLKLDREIDDGFGGNPARRPAESAARSPGAASYGSRRRAKRDLEASIEALKKEKERLASTLRGDDARQQRGRVKKAAQGWLSAPGGWFADGGDVQKPEQSEQWGY